MEKILSVIGTGPGKIEDMTIRAYRTISEAELIVGYTVYNDLLKDTFPDKEYYSTPMTQEVERCMYAIKKAEAGIRTVMVCSGDSGIYGMASLLAELIESMHSAVELDIIPGITAAISGGALLGSPLTSDFAVISLSDLLTPWEVIEKRLRGAAAGDFVIVLYNPGSKKRSGHLEKACRIIMESRSPDTLCGIVSNISRLGEKTENITLAQLSKLQAGMFSTVFIGNTQTKIIKEKLITPRGYMKKYFTQNISSEIKKNNNETPLHMHSTKTNEKSKIFSDCTYANTYSLGDNSNICTDDTNDNKALTHLLIFGGTTEGRLLTQTACEAGYCVTLCVATDYGAEVVTGGLGDTDKDVYSYDEDVGISASNQTKYNSFGNRLRINSRGLEESDMEVLMHRLKAENRAGVCVIDATHPYAAEVTGKIAKTAEKCGIRYIRVLRNLKKIFRDEKIENKYLENITAVSDMEEAVRVLNRSDEKVFISTGSNAAGKLAEVKNAAKRLTLRVLPSAKALEKCRNAGFEGKNIICMQGPFSVEINKAMFIDSGAKILLTKFSGKAGGFAEKIRAAAEADMKIIVIMPPEERSGLSFEEVSEYERKRLL